MINEFCDIYDNSIDDFLFGFFKAGVGSNYVLLVNCILANVVVIKEINRFIMISTTNTYKQKLLRAVFVAQLAEWSLFDDRLMDN